MSEIRRLSHAKDIIGLIEAGYSTHVPIVFTDIIPKATDGTQIINVKGRNLGSVYKTQTTFSIAFEGYVPVVTVYQTEIEANNTAQLLLIIQGQSIPMSMVVVMVNTDKRRDINYNNMTSSRVKDATLNNLDDVSLGTQARGNVTDVLYVASGYLNEVSVVSTAGDFIKIKGVMHADEVLVGGSEAPSIFGAYSPNIFSYLS